MDNTNKWTNEYNVEIDKIDEYSNSPHYWDKNVVYITPDKKYTQNYRFRLGIQLRPLPNNSNYTICVETIFNDYLLWHKSEIFINGTSIIIKSHHTKKMSFDAGSSGAHNWIYYSRTIISLRKFGSTPFYLYYRIHIDDNGGDLNTYPQNYTGMYILAYGPL